MTNIICRPATGSAIAGAARLLRDGALAIVPTDTVYGIVGDVRIDDAVRAIRTAKGRDEGEPLQLLFGPDLEMLRGYADLDGFAGRLVEALGPGPWTIVVPVVPGWTSAALAGGSTLGFRIPASKVIHKLVSELGGPVAASSANRHGQPSPLTCREALAGVGSFCAVALDDGPAPVGVDSTVIDCSGETVRILREGAIDRATVARILGVKAIPVARSVRK
jgi:L-threonylcarbamoyladenylate synthase